VIAGRAAERLVSERSGETGNWLFMKHETCMSYVTNGAFDPAKPDRQYGSPAGVTGPSEGTSGYGCACWAIAYDRC